MPEHTPGTTGKKTLAVYAIVDKENRPSIWIRVGTAFSNRDGSLNLYLDAFPIGTNRLQVREARPADEQRPRVANGHGAAGDLEPEARP
jgi:hypothetical protein